jgi:hypothetical protein
MVTIIFCAREGIYVVRLLCIPHVSTYSGLLKLLWLNVQIRNVFRDFFLPMYINTYGSYVYLK